MMTVQMVKLGECCEIVSGSTPKTGVTDVFNPNLESYIKRRHKKIMKKLKVERDSTKKFISFFRLSKECGMEVMNQ